MFLQRNVETKSIAQEPIPWRQEGIETHQAEDHTADSSQLKPPLDQANASFTLPTTIAPATESAPAIVPMQAAWVPHRV